MFKVYIASPYTMGDQAVNVATSMKVASELINHNLCPFWPLHQHFLHMMYPQNYETWMRMNFAWIEGCNAVLRLPGLSKGADREVQYAYDLGTPVFTSLENLLNFADPTSIHSVPHHSV